MRDHQIPSVMQDVAHITLMMRSWRFRWQQVTGQGVMA
jgi:hypothetical protein